MTFDDVVRALRTARLVDQDLLTAAERVEVQQTLTQLQQRGLTAYVVRLPPSEELQAWHPLWTALGLRDPQALLLLYNGRRWEARGWGLSGSTISTTLGQAESALRQHQGAGLRTALNLLAAQTTPAARPTARKDSGTGRFVWLGAGALVVLGGLGWVLMRRRQMQQQTTQTFEAACAAADAAFTQVMLEEALLDTQIQEAQLRATTYKQQLDAVRARVAEGHRAAGDPVVLGEVQQLTNQFAGLHATILRRQKEHRLC